MSRNTDPSVANASKVESDNLLDIASHLVHHDDIRAIHVVTPTRPSYRDLQHYRHRAENEGMTLTVDAHSIVFRAKPMREDIETEQPAHPAHPFLSRHWHVPQVARAGWHWVHDHAVAWQAGFTGLNEGVR